MVEVGVCEVDPEEHDPSRARMVKLIPRKSNRERRDISEHPE
jgi:hypothetical protein